MATFDSVADLAAALYCDGRRPIDTDRLRKFARHVRDRDQFEAVLALLPSEAQGQTEQGLTDLCAVDPKFRIQVAGWWP